jgi:hypothetical protein
MRLLSEMKDENKDAAWAIIGKGAVEFFMPTLLRPSHPSPSYADYVQS